MNLRAFPTFCCDEPRRERVAEGERCSEVYQLGFFPGQNIGSALLCLFAPVLRSTSSSAAAFNVIKH